MYQQFEQSAKDVQNLSQKPSNEELLQLYGLYKQATIGDNETSQPSMFDFKGKSKWNAWNALKGTTKEKAMVEYIKLVNQLKSKY